jgi:hypothetical protein
MRKPTNKTFEALRWWYCEHRCPSCCKIPSDSFNILSVTANPEVSIFSVQVITQCPSCNYLQIHALESEKSLQRIVDQHKAKWLNV